MRALLAALLTAAVPTLAQEIRAVRIAAGVPAPTDIQNAGDGSGRLFFVQQDGLVRIFRNGTIGARPFLDIRSRTRGEGERGLLGLTFPPGFARKQVFYVNYTDLNGNTVIARYRVSPDPDVADPSSETVLMNIAQPFPNHNGGQLRFGPDGYLYVGMGDGGSAGDPRNNGQNRAALLGKLLRLDVESVPDQVRIPPDNPFANTPGARPEIWALGLRNPWRFSFDRATGDLWIADVGQDSFEEVNFQPAASRGGENYGWNAMEGMHCYLANCNQQGLTMPVAEYPHGQECSITGGFVYRGRVSPGLRGTYIYGDFCSGRIWGVERAGAGWRNRLLLASGFGITTFGEDEAGEIYVASFEDESIYHLEGGLAPRFSAAGVVNAASFAPGLTPGSLATIFAAGVLDDPGIVSADQLPLPASLSGVSVTVNGIAAPLLAVANAAGQEQINFQAPFEISGRSTASVVVTRGGRASAAVDVPVADVQPAIYSSGGEAILVRATDYSLVSAARPLQAGESVFLYAAGLGVTANQPPTGAAAPSAPPATAAARVQVTLAGLPCDVQYAGLAPGLAGVYQVNFRVPPGVPPGSRDLVLIAGSVSSPPVRAP
jgi:uncharacterized protein (TIGR03437 family)